MPGRPRAARPRDGLRARRRRAGASREAGCARSPGGPRGRPAGSASRSRGAMGLPRRDERVQVVADLAGAGRDVVARVAQRLEAPSRRPSGCWRSRGGRPPGETMAGTSAGREVPVPPAVPEDPRDREAARRSRPAWEGGRRSSRRSGPPESATTKFCAGIPMRWATSTAARARPPRPRGRGCRGWWRRDRPPSSGRRAAARRAPRRRRGPRRSSETPSRRAPIPGRPPSRSASRRAAGPPPSGRGRARGRSLGRRRRCPRCRRSSS